MIDLLPDPPSPADDLATFNSKAGASVAAYPRMVVQINAEVIGINTNAAAASDAATTASSAATTAGTSATTAQQAASSANSAASTAGSKAGDAAAAASAAASARQSAEAARDQAQAAANQTGGVKTVNGKSPNSSGAIMLAAADVGAASTSDLASKLAIGQFGIGGFTGANTGDCNNPPIGWVTGYFNGNANTPPGSTSATIHQIVSAQDYVAQYAAINSAGNGRTWAREQFNGTWGAWRQLVTAREPVITIPGGGGTLDCSLGTDFFISINGSATVTLANVPAGVGIAYRAELHVECYSGALTFAGPSILWSGKASLQPGANYFFEIKAHPTAGNNVFITQSGAHAA